MYLFEFDFGVKCKWSLKRLADTIEIVLTKIRKELKEEMGNSIKF